MVRIMNRPESKLVALLPAGHRLPTFQELDDNVGRSDLSIAIQPRPGGARCHLLEAGLDRMAIDVRVRPTAALSAPHIQLARLSGPEIDAAQASRSCVTVSCRIRHDPLVALHAQLRALAALAPDAVAVLDLGACEARSGDWMRDVPSAPERWGLTSFFSIHSVLDDAGETWLHTHGLRRMGSIELDIVGIRNDEASTLAGLINTVARLFVERGVPPPNTPFETAQSLPLIWVPCDRAWHVMSDIAGPFERDAEHARQRGILLAPALDVRRGFEPPRRYVPLLRSDAALQLKRALGGGSPPRHLLH